MVGLVGNENFVARYLRRTIADGDPDPADPALSAVVAVGGAPDILAADLRRIIATRKPSLRTFILLSTSAVYFPSRRLHREADRVRRNDDELLLRSYFRSFPGFADRGVCLRLGAPYGWVNGFSETGWIMELTREAVRAKAEGRPISIPGNGREARSILRLESLPSIIEGLMYEDLPRWTVLNAADGKLKVGAWADALARVLGIGVSRGRKRGESLCVNPMALAKLVRRYWSPRPVRLEEAESAVREYLAFGL